MRPLKLTAAMHLLLNGPAAGAEEWLDGEQLFASAVQNDDAANSLLHELSIVLTPAPARAGR